MSTGIWIAASGASAQLTALDVAANNTANATTQGFKADQLVFQQHLIDAERAGNGAEHMRYGGVREVASDMRGGAIKVTGRALDVAIRGEGFFAVDTPQGEAFTRAGGFEVSLSGHLVTVDGQRVLNTARRPISVSRGAGELRISENGTVYAGEQPVGQLRTVDFDNPRGLEKEGQLLFRATAVSGAARKVDVALEPGALEMSNVSIVKGMTEIVSTTRSFDALEQAIDAFKSIEQRAANDIMRPR